MSVDTVLNDAGYHVSYSSNWKKGVSEDSGVAEADSEPGVTTNFTTAAGAHVMVVFNGSAISVLGTVAADGSPAIFAFILDRQEVSEYAVHYTGKARHREIFYTSAKLDPGEHRLRITNIIDGGTLALDAFEVKTDPPDYTGVIIGGTLGGVAIICIALLCVFLLYYKRPPKPKSADEVNLIQTHSEIVPFDIYQAWEPPSSQSSYFLASTASARMGPPSILAPQVKPTPARTSNV
ncbi:hypothetical protein FA15DRAFT_707609 [Coprinopsis marcescibilis]|uniref:Uncharacterized protein n=1 Tax=Coprinopsis marcescibilis TaxID=230819 RepID=A0A5C3KKY9_COPMA|nr:hypothetical protein FA15DRAFT_707609 [Coprinopsis marcescibilis]